MRWTTKGIERRFHSTILAKGGNLKSLGRIDVEQEVKVLYPGRPGRVGVGPRGRVHVLPGRAPVVATKDEDKVDIIGEDRIVFSARTDDDIDGFDRRPGLSEPGGGRSQQSKTGTPAVRGAPALNRQDAGRFT